jgi:hypothetical protein
MGGKRGRKGNAKEVKVGSKRVRKKKMTIEGQGV